MARVHVGRIFCFLNKVWMQATSAMFVSLHRSPSVTREVAMHALSALLDDMWFPNVDIHPNTKSVVSIISGKICAGNSFSCWSTVWIIWWYEAANLWIWFQSIKYPILKLENSPWVGTFSKRSSMTLFWTLGWLDTNQTDLMNKYKCWYYFQIQSST